MIDFEVMLHVIESHKYFVELPCDVCI